MTKVVKKAVRNDLDKVEQPLLSVVVIYRMEDQHNIGELLMTLPKFCEVILVETSHKPNGKWKEDRCYKIERDLKSKITLAKYHYKTGVCVKGVWCPRFDYARNAAKTLARGKWIASVDADERFLVHQLRLLEDILKRHDKIEEISALTTVNNGWHKSSIAGDIPKPVTSNQIRIFENLPEIRWFGAAHENINRSLNELGKKVIPTAIMLHHVGYCATDGEMLDKLERNVRLMMECDYSECTESQKNEFFRLITRDSQGYMELKQEMIKQGTFKE